MAKLFYFINVVAYRFKAITVVLRFKKIAVTILISNGIVPNVIMLTIEHFVGNAVNLHKFLFPYFFLFFFCISASVISFTLKCMKTTVKRNQIVMFENVGILLKYWCRDYLFPNPM